MNKTLEIINKTGYPFQLNLKRQIEDTFQKHRCSVEVEEHRWVNSKTNEEGFIDLVLRKEGFNLRLVIECKRLNGTWTFLVPQENPREQNSAISLLVEHSEINRKWTEIRLRPSSLEASFCVPETSGQSDNRTLEKIAGKLLLSLEYLESEETNIFVQTRRSANIQAPHTMIYLPIIVTTAQLQAIQFSASNITKNDAKLIADKSKIIPIEYIRFTKNLATTFQSPPNMIHLTELNQAYDRTVFVVQAESFINFLSEFALLR